MPYDRLEDLPEKIKSNLPKGAQKIFRSAFNSAWDSYGKEATANKVAWSAVKKKYDKEGGEWKRR